MQTFKIFWGMKAMDLWKIMQAISVIIQSARRLYEVPRPEPSDMNNTIKQLESNCIEQSKLIEQTAENIKALTKALQVLNDRVKKVSWISQVALIIGVLFILKELFDIISYIISYLRSV